MYHPEAEVEPQLRLPIRTKPTDKSISEPALLFRMTEEISRKEGSEYLFEDANQRYLTQADVNGLTAQAACYAKNEIYARRGRKFNSVELQEYFGSKSWYNGTIDPASFTGSQFNDYELKNIEILKNKEFSLASGGYLLDQPGYNINAVGTISRK